MDENQTPSDFTMSVSDNAVQTSGTVTTWSQLEKRLSLHPAEKAYRESAPAEALPLAITGYYLNLVKKYPQSPLRLQCIPRAAELSVAPVELADPLGEADHSPQPRLIHRYPDRALLLVTGKCALYCRHCFRRTFTSADAGSITQEQIIAAGEYLKKHKEIKELLLSGGDALMFSDAALEDLLSSLRAARPDLMFRLATRMPVVQPSRITERLVALLAKFQPVWVVTQFNHPLELTEQARTAVDRLVDAGIPVLNQTVLLRNVNDSVAVLKELFQGLVACRVKPYYLFQGDLAEGTAHFRVPLAKSWELVKKLRTRISGLAMPSFAVDLPGGGGKIPLTESYLVGEEPDAFLFQSFEGEIFRYPKE